MLSHRIVFFFVFCFFFKGKSATENRNTMPEWWRIYDVDSTQCAHSVLLRTDAQPAAVDKVTWQTKGSYRSQNMHLPHRVIRGRSCAVCSFFLNLQHFALVLASVEMTEFTATAWLNRIRHQSRTGPCSLGSITNINSLWWLVLLVPAGKMCVWMTWRFGS